MNIGASYAECERIARRAASHFYPAFMILPRAQRRGMYALYAFNRMTDDIADRSADGNSREDLDRWQSTLDTVLDGECEHSTLTALCDTVRRFDIPRQYLHDVIEGCRLDLGRPRFPTFTELRRYCQLVASSVGLACIHIWGFHGDRAIEHADAAGIALQLTNIFRDLKEDRDRGRVYLPMEDLDRFGCDHNNICTDAKCASFQAMMRFQVDRAKSYYETARGLDECLSATGRAVNRVIVGTYRRLLERIELVGFDVFSKRITVPRREKMAIVMKALPSRMGWTRG